MTLIGWVFLLTPLVIVGYAAVRLAPVYLNYMKVTRALEQTGSELKSGGVNPENIRATIDKHFEIDMVEYPQVKDFKIQRDGAAWVVEAAYEDEAPLFANLSLHVTFDKVVRIGNAD